MLVSFKMQVLSTYNVADRIEREATEMSIISEQSIFSGLNQTNHAELTYVS